MDLSLLFVFAAMLIVMALLFAVIGITKNGNKQLDVDRYRVKWMATEHQLVREQISSYHLAVLNGDKLVDQALREKGIKGQNMGERLKNGAQLFTNRNNVWMAHKLRNQIAHEPDVSVTYEMAQQALSAFRQALKDIGAI